MLVRDITQSVVLPRSFDSSSSLWCRFLLLVHLRAFDNLTSLKRRATLCLSRKSLTTYDVTSVAPWWLYVCPHLQTTKHLKKDDFRRKWCGASSGSHRSRISIVTVNSGCFWRRVILVVFCLLFSSDFRTSLSVAERSAWKIRNTLSVGRRNGLSSLGR